jgi:hypothetical protein
MASSFFSRGYYKKPGACPRVFDSDGKWDVERSVAACNLPVSADRPLLVEEKYNGNRGIFEFKDGKGCLHSGKKGCHDNGFPAKVARMIEQQFSIANDVDASVVEEVLGKEFAGKIKELQSVGKIDDVILDGEMYLEDCNGKIPGLATQARAIKGSHPDLERDCIFSYKVYDIIKLNGKDVTRLPLAKRKELLSDVLPYVIMNSGEGISVEVVKGTEATSPSQISTIASALVNRGHEGIVVKDPASKYDWKGRGEDRPDTAGWWKVKNATSIDATVTSACLGNPGKTGINAFRYKLFSLGACKDKACKEIVPITARGVSHSATGGEFSGDKKWNDNLHAKVIDAIGSGKARPGKEWRVVTKAAVKMQRSGDFAGLIGGMAKDGKPGLPRCVSIAPGTINVTVAGLEFNIDKNGNPKINGPPLLVKSSKRISTIKEIMELPSVHV